MSSEESERTSVSTRDFSNWFSGRKNEIERWVDSACQHAVSKARGVIVEEIRGLSKRVEQMHELLDQLEHYVDSPRSGGGGDEGSLPLDHSQIPSKKMNQ